jgi:hypothetical protein
MPDHPYDFPNDDVLGNIERFDENKKKLARRTVLRYVHTSADRSDMFDALDIWPETIARS